MSLQQGMSPDFGISTLQTGIHGTRDSSTPRWRLSNLEEVSVELHVSRHSPNPRACSASDKSSVVNTTMLVLLISRSASIALWMPLLCSWEPLPKDTNHGSTTKCGPSAPRSKKKLHRGPASSTGPMAHISPPIHVFASTTTIQCRLRLDLCWPEGSRRRGSPGE